MAFLNVFVKEREDLPAIEICSIDTPLCLGFTGLLLHAEDPAVFCDLGDGQTLSGGIVGNVDRDQGGSVLLAVEIVHVLHAVGEDIVACEDDHILVDVLFLDGIDYVSDGTSLVGVIRRAVVQDNDGSLAVPGRCDRISPFRELSCESGIGNEDDLGYLVQFINGIDYIIDDQLLSQGEK